MKKRLSIFLLICGILISSIIGIEGVWANFWSGYEEGSSSEISLCEGSTYCYSGAVGFRITIVDIDTGERCKFDSKTGEICGTSGELIESKDYWFDKSEIKEYVDKNYCFAYDAGEKEISKPTKAEHIIGGYSYNGNASCGEVYGNGKAQDITDLFGEKLPKNGWVPSNDIIEASRNPKNMTVIEQWFRETQAKGDTTATDIIFKALIGKNTNEIDGLENVTVQFEQLLMVVNYNNKTEYYERAALGFAAMGTVAESTWIYLNKEGLGQTKTDMEYDRWCTIYDYKQSTSTKFSEFANLRDCNSSMFSGGYWTGWSGTLPEKSTKFNLEYDNNPNPVQNITKYLSGKFTTSDLDLSYFYGQTNTANVFSIAIDDALLYNCNEDARDIIERYCNNGSCYGDDEKIEDYMDALKTESDDVLDTCFDDSGNLKDTCHQLEPSYLKFVGIAPEGEDDTEKKFTNLVTDVCLPRTCDSTTLAIVEFNHGTNNAAYHSAIRHLYNLTLSDGSRPFYQDNMLYEVYAEIFGTTASCKDETSNCTVSDTPVSCTSGGNVFTLSDTTADGCLENGVAYFEKVNGKIKESTTQSSRDSDYGDKSYCSESVQFSFPVTGTGMVDVIAGTTFKWGIDTDKTSAKFGAMTVTRKCTINGKNSIPVDWAKVGISNGARINPNITIHYKQAIPENATISKPWTVSASLETKLVKFTIDGQDVTLKDSGQTIYNCGGSCNGKTIQMTASYDLNYGESLKWYTLADNAASNISSEVLGEDELDEHSPYTFIGYGLPTSFLTPTNLTPIPEGQYGKFKIGDSITDDKDGNGYLYATVKNVGTKNNYKNTNRYHFDNYINFAITQEKINDDSATTPTIYYNCGYSLRNDLFGYRTPDTDEDEPPKGLDVVFRTIDLFDSSNLQTTEGIYQEAEEAFPGRAGTLRTLGANWNVVRESQEIFDILSDEIYNREPMYTIVLDVSLIQRIRRYNDAMRDDGRDPYTNMAKVTNSSSATESNGYGGYMFYKPEGSKVIYKYSLFLEYLATGCTNSEGESCLQQNAINPCIQGVDSHVSACNQSWWDASNPNQGPTDDEEETTE